MKENTEKCQYRGYCSYITSTAVGYFVCEDCGQQLTPPNTMKELKDNTVV